MATYKVIQDIEAEDHILGPLSLRQFIYALITVFFLYLSFIVLTKHAAFLLVLFLPPALFTGFLAFPFGKDQPTEVWALAKLRFLFKPRTRIWNQSGMKELVTITVPKKIETQLTNGLNQTEVKSRLAALANTIDSRGWAIKNASGGGYMQSSVLAVSPDSDRLVNIASLPQAVPDYDITASEDILDDQASPLAQQFTQMINTSTQAHHQQLMDELNEVRISNAATNVPNWFMNAPLGTPASSGVSTQTSNVAPATSLQPVPTGLASTNEPTADEAAVVEKAHLKQAAAAQANARMATLQPLVASNSQSSLQVDGVSAVASQTLPAEQPATGATTPDPAILKLANNNDLNVATLAREAGKAKELDGSGGEVVITLH